MTSLLLNYIFGKDREILINESDLGRAIRTLQFFNILGVKVVHCGWAKAPEVFSVQFKATHSNWVSVLRTFTEMGVTIHSEAIGY